MKHHWLTPEKPLTRDEHKLVKALLKDTPSLMANLTSASVDVLRHALSLELEKERPRRVIAQRMFGRLRVLQAGQESLEFALLLCGKK